MVSLFPLLVPSTYWLVDADFSDRSFIQAASMTCCQTKVDGARAYPLCQRWGFSGSLRGAGGGADGPDAGFPQAFLRPSGRQLPGLLSLKATALLFCRAPSTSLECGGDREHTCGRGVFSLLCGGHRQPCR